MFRTTFESCGGDCRRASSWIVALMAMAACGTSSSGDDTPQGTPGADAGAPSSDAAVGSEGDTGIATGPGRDAQGSDAPDVSDAPDAHGPDAEGPDAGVAADAGGADATVIDSGAADAKAQADTGSAAPPDAASASDAGAVTCASPFGGGPTPTTTTHLDIGVHDPSMTWDGNLYYLFATGGTLNIRSSPNLSTWSNVGNIFPAVPAWITTALGANPGSLWAPDISYFEGMFHVYYAGSTFGSNSSVIGLATNTTLHASNVGAWVDQGMVVQSTTPSNFNAIDPNVSFDQNCAPWLAYGSFWTGIKLHKLDATTGKLATDDTTTYSLAERPGEGAIEGASIISHNGFFYLFVSFDLCCQGVNSTYRTMVGRSTGSITGPYADMAGTPMLQGGADQLLATSGRYIGPGGGTAWKDGNTYLYAYHYYDGDNAGAPELQIRPITFDANDWIVLGDPLFP
jgi:arabinan endo-1,5-alpha-L-arabinosidase